MISLVLTHFNRFIFLQEAIHHVKDDPRIDEIVISDDVSTDGSYGWLVEHFQTNPKVKVYQNERNLDCYANKAKAVERATSPWVILFDSDNILSTEYLDAIYRCREWDRHTAYLPEFAQPHFDYRTFSGAWIDRGNIAELITRKHCATMLNTANYFIHRDEYLRVWDGSVDPHTADSLFQNYNWLRAGNRLHVVPGLHYFHRVHNQSHYKQNVHKTGNFAQHIESKIRLLQ